MSLLRFILTSSLPRTDFLTLGQSCANLQFTIWFTVFLGWLIKHCILRYGGLTAYRQARPLFLDLILGQFTCNDFWIVIVFLSRNSGNSIFWIWRATLIKNQSIRWALYSHSLIPGKVKGHDKVEPTMDTASPYSEPPQSSWHSNSYLAIGCLPRR